MRTFKNPYLGFEIYKINQDISGIKGGLDFENVKDFSSEAVDPW